MIAVRLSPAASATEVFDNPTFLAIFADAREQATRAFRVAFTLALLHLAVLCGYVAEVATTTHEAVGAALETTMPSSNASFSNSSTAERGVNLTDYVYGLFEFDDENGSGSGIGLDNGEGLDNGGGLDDDSGANGSDPAEAIQQAAVDTATRMAQPAMLVPLVILLLAAVTIRVVLTTRYHKSFPSAGAYLFDFWTITNLLYIGTQVISLAFAFAHERAACAAVGGIAALLGFVNVMYYLQWFREFAALIRMLQHCLFGLAKFFVILGALVVGATMLMFSMQKQPLLTDGISCDPNDFPNSAGHVDDLCTLSWLDMLFQMFMALLVHGEIDEHLARLEYASLAKVEWVAVCSISFILGLNVLISLLNDLYEQIKERESIEVLAMQNMLVYDLTQLRTFFQMTSGSSNSRLVSLAEADEDEETFDGFDEKAEKDNNASAAGGIEVPLYYIQVILPVKSTPKDMLLRESNDWTGIIGKINKDSKRRHDEMSEGLESSFDTMTVAQKRADTRMQTMATSIERLEAQLQSAPENNDRNGVAESRRLAITAELPKSSHPSAQQATHDTGAIVEKVDALESKIAENERKTGAKLASLEGKLDGLEGKLDGILGLLQRGARVDADSAVTVTRVVTETMRVPSAQVQQPLPLEDEFRGFHVLDGLDGGGGMDM